VKTFPTYLSYTYVRSILLCICCLLFISMTVYAGGVTQGPEPAWVKVNTFDPAATAPAKKMEEGYYYLLLDKQTNMASQQTYSRYVRKIVTDAGVQSCTRVSIDYNRSYEHIIIHSIRIIRDGQASNRLSMSKFKVIDSQGELANNQYNDDLTSVLLLEDVRVGDILDVSYTDVGYNPVFENKYYEYFTLGYSTPVARLYTALIAPDSRPLQFKYINDAPKPKISHGNGSSSYVWEIAAVPLVKYDDQTPTGYDAYPAVSVSEYGSWLEVKKWAQRIFAASLDTHSPEVKQLAQAIHDQYRNEDDRLIAAVKYVQDKVRYFGNETGLNTHKPHLPAATLHLGYGDCKDKSILLCTLLRDMGITAHPILISTYNGGMLIDHLPTATIFNHTCVQVVIHDSTYYFDATMNSQKADLAHYHFPRYGYGLVVTDTSSGLTAIPYSDNGARTLMFTRIIADDTTRPARMIVTTTYYGIAADRFREDWNTESHQETEKKYLNFYAREYPGVEAKEDLQITADDSAVNMIQTEEVYTIENFWTHTTADAFSREFFAYNLNGLLNKPNDKKRTMPIGITYPEHYVEEYEVVLPFDFTPQRPAQLISNDAFVFTGEYTCSSKDKTLHLRYTYDTKQDFMPAAKAAIYFADITKVVDMIDYNIVWHPYLVDTSSDFSYFMFFIFLIALVASVWLGYKVYIGYDPPAAVHPLQGRGVGGWLIIPALNVIFLPLYLLYLMVASHYFSENNVDIIFNKSAANYQPPLGYLIIFDMISKTLLTVWSFLLFILFFQKRTSFPRIFPLYFAYNAAIQFIVIAGNALIKNDNTGRGTTLLRTIIFTVIWGLYMQRSIRVRETFVNTRHAYPEPGPYTPDDRDETAETITDDTAETTEGHDHYMPLPDAGV
jgi:transglutaminase-like putative cysteine protease